MAYYLTNTYFGYLEVKNTNVNILVYVITFPILGVILIIVAILLCKFRNKINWPCNRKYTQNIIASNNDNTPEYIFEPSYNTFSGNTIDKENENQEIPLISQEIKNETNEFIDKPHCLDKNQNDDNKLEVMICYPPVAEIQSDNSDNNNTIN